MVQTKNQRRPAVHLVDPDTLAETRPVQQEDTSAVNVEWKDISKSNARQQKGGVRQTRIKQHRDSKRGAANMVDSQDNEDDPVYAFEVDIKK